MRNLRALPRGRGRWAVGAVVAVATGLVVSGPLGAGSSASVRASIPQVAAAGQVTAHDGEFWLGGSPIILRGTNGGVTCCAGGEFQRMAGWGMNFVRLQWQWS